MCPSEPHPATLPEPQLLRDCEIRFDRRSGPGGQHRNKVETAVVITHRPTGVQGEASERRSQAANRRTATFRLRVNLALAVRSDQRFGETASPLWQARIRGGRIALRPDHEDFPSLLAELLDVLSEHQLDLRAASAALGITPSQIVRMLKMQPRALQQVNQGRGQQGKGTLR